MLSDMLPFVAATLVSLLSVVVLKWRVGDLFPIKIGEYQIFLKKAGPGEKCSNICKVLKGKTQEVKIFTHNFPASEYSKGKPFREALENWHKEGVAIKLIGGPNVEAKEDIRRLVKRGILVAKKITKPPKEHVLIIDKPPQLWIEKKHKGEVAKNIYYTDKPYQSVFRDSNSFFDFLWAKGTPV